MIKKAISKAKDGTFFDAVKPSVAKRNKMKRLSARKGGGGGKKTKMER
jgi:hypothetical protein